MLPWNLRPPKSEPQGVAEALRLMAVQALYGGDMKLAAKLLIALRDNGAGPDILPLYPERVEVVVQDMRKSEEDGCNGS